MQSFENLVCPVDKNPLISSSGCFYCSLDSCFHSKAPNGFKLENGVPILISEKMCDTVCSSENINSYVPRTNGIYSSIRSFLFAPSKVTVSNCKSFVGKVKSNSDKPKVLVIGSGEKGSGTESLWSDKSISIVGADIYLSESVDVICDAHYLPFDSDSFVGVWIQAVLEHVVQPNVVVCEIFRILKDGGIIYAETPFMQQVHEGAYDFTRFTVLGHRYLFKNFEEISYGGNKGPEVVLAWSIKYFFWGLLRSKKIGSLIGIFFQLLLKPFEYFFSKNALFDASSGVYFLCKKTNNYQLSHKDLEKKYDGFMTNK